MHAAIGSLDHSIGCTHPHNLWLIQRSNTEINLKNMDEAQSKSSNFDDPMGRLAVKHLFAWYGWASPVGLGLFLVEVGGLLWLLHLANIIR